MNRRVFSLAAMLIGLCSCRAIGEPVTLDMLGGIGDFEYSVFSHWSTAYTGADFDPNSMAENLTVDQSSPPWTVCVSTPTSDRTIAVGWSVVAEASLHPQQNIIARLMDASPNKGMAQYFAINRSGRVALQHAMRLDREAKDSIKPGDTITLKIDRIRMSNFSDLPADASCQCSAAIMLGTFDIGETVTPSTEWTSFEVSKVVPEGVTQATIRVYIEASGDVGTVERGVYVNGVHLYVKHSGETDYAEVEIPPVEGRSFNTYQYFYQQDDIVTIAESYDVMVLLIWNYALIPRLRYFNPNMKVYLYQPCDIIQFTDPEWTRNCVTYDYAVKNHSEWLYPDTASPGSYLHDGSSYYAQLASASYQQQYLTETIARLQAVKCHGLWIDVLQAMMEKKDDSGNIIKPKRNPWEVQQFIHGLLPSLRTAGLDMSYNGCGTHLAGVASVYFSPNWTPTSPYNSSDYTANSADSTPDMMFQEYGFFVPNGSGTTGPDDYNDYNPVYWKQTLDDMDTVSAWDSTMGIGALPTNRKKRWVVFIYGVDRTEDPASGVDGWLQFGLSSYLLGQSEWTYLAWGLRPTYVANMDLTAATQLGSPTAVHEAINGDDYFRLRRYGPSVGGATGGVVVVNANTTERTFTLDFDGTDEAGNALASGTSITIRPHTGRIFLKQKGPVYVRIRVPTSTVTSGDTVTITVDYLNSSTQSSVGVVLTAKVPSEMTYVSGSAEKSGGSYDPSTNTITWRIGDVVAGQSGRRTFEATVK